MGCGVSSSHNALSHRPTAGDANQNKEAPNDVVIRNFIQYSNRVHNITSATNKTNSSLHGKAVVPNHDEHTETHNLLPQTHEIAKSDTAFSFEEESSLSPSSLHIAHKTTESALTNEEKMIVAKLQAGYLRKDLSAVSAVLSVFEDDKGFTVTAANGTSQNKTLKICRWLDRVLTEKRAHEDKFFNPEMPEVWPKHLQEITDNMTVHSGTRKLNENYHVEESSGNDSHQDQYNRSCKTNTRSDSNRKVHSDSSDDGHDNVVSNTSGGESSNNNNKNNNNNNNGDDNSSNEIVVINESCNENNRKYYSDRVKDKKNNVGDNYNEEDDEDDDDENNQADDDEEVHYKMDHHNEQDNMTRAISHTTNKQNVTNVVNDHGIGVGERITNNRWNYEHRGHEHLTAVDINEISNN